MIVKKVEKGELQIGGGQDCPIRKMIKMGLLVLVIFLVYKYGIGGEMPNLGISE